MEEFQQIQGPDNESHYYGRSLQDARPFVEICSDLGGEFTVSLNPIDFTDADFEEIVRFVSDSENGQIETLAKKAFEPEIEIVATLATKILQCLIVKKLLDKTAEKISDDIARCYDKIKQLAAFIFSKIKDGREITYILSAPNQPVELIVRCDKADVLATAITEKDNGYISEVYESLSQHLNGEIKKIQFLFNVETYKWELNYICILGKEFLLVICHDCQQLILIPANQLEQFLVLLAGRSIIFCRFNVTIPEFFQNVHNITLLKKCV